MVVTTSTKLTVCSSTPLIVLPCVHVISSIVNESRDFPDLPGLSSHSYLSFIGPVPVICLPSSEKDASPPVIVREAFLSNPLPGLSSNSRYLSVTLRRPSGCNPT